MFLCDSHLKFWIIQLCNKFSEKWKYFSKNWSTLVETTMIENESFPCKTLMSEANVKANRMGSTKWTYHKERTFASSCFIFLKILFQCKNLLQRVNLIYQLPKCSYLYFSEALEFYLRVLFPCEYPYLPELLPWTTNSCTHCHWCSTITINHITQTTKLFLFL